MFKRTMTSLLIVVCISLVVVAGGALAQTGQETVYIHPQRWDSSQTVYSDQEIVFLMGWASCHKGMVNSYLSSVNLVFLVESKPLFPSKAAANRYWGPVSAMPAASGASACKGNTPANLWRADWKYTYGTLEPGDYTVLFDHFLDHPVTDGADYDGDGKPDVFKGELAVREFTIHVEARP